MNTLLLHNYCNRLKYYVSCKQLLSLEITKNSYLGDYYAYREKWCPLQGHIHELLLARELNSTSDKLAVAVIRNGDIMGHVPYNSAPTLSQS